MPKNLINAGDTVVFAQQYINPSPYLRLYGQTGKVMKLLGSGRLALVAFDADPGMPEVVHSSDLEIFSASEHPVNETYDQDRPGVVPLEVYSRTENDELGGMSRAQLIAQKLIAQETDPVLDYSISELIEN